MIAPSHGVIWRRGVPSIVAAYRDWVACRPKAKVLVLYDTMWESTAAMAEAIVEGAAQPGVETALFHLRRSSLTQIAAEVLDAAAVAFGSPDAQSRPDARRRRRAELPPRPAAGGQGRPWPSARTAGGRAGPRRSTKGSSRFTGKCSARRSRPSIVPRPRCSTSVGRPARCWPRRRWKRRR